MCAAGGRVCEGGTNHNRAGASARHRSGEKHKHYCGGGGCELTEWSRRTRRIPPDFGGRGREPQGCRPK